MSARAVKAAALALGLATGLCGLRWGVPTEARLAAFPDSLKPTPEVAAKFAAAWAELYRGIEQTHKEKKGEEPVTYVQGVETIPADWTWPPPKLLNSYRSLLLRSEQPDEQKPFIVLARMRPWRLEFEPLWIHYGGAFIYPLGAWLQALAWTGAVTLVPDMSRYLQHPAEMGGLYTAGRLFVLLFHLGGIWLIYDLGERLSGRRTGFFAAALFSLSPLVLVNSHSLKPHPYSAFWALAAVRFAALAVQGGETASYVRSGLCAGMAAGSNFSFLPFFACGPLAFFLRGMQKKEELRALAKGVAGGALVFLLTNPYAVLMRANYLWETTVYTTRRSRPTPAALGALVGPYLAWQLGLAAQLLGAAGIFQASRRGAGRARLLVSAVAVFGAAVIWAGLAFLWGFVEGPEALRFFYPLLGLFCVLAADAVSALPKPWARALLCLALVETGMRGAPYLRALALDNSPRGTRAMAAGWIERNIPAGASVGLPRYPQPATTPVFRYDTRTLVLYDDPSALDAKRLPEFIVTDASGHGPVLAELYDRYEYAAVFRPKEFGFARLRDTSFFADAPFFIFKRRASAKTK
jgi:hypothetical protein